MDFVGTRVKKVPFESDFLFKIIINIFFGFLVKFNSLMLLNKKGYGGDKFF
jgi:hypothetical protein